jgi:homoserine dehydrogenase
MNFTTKFLHGTYAIDRHTGVASIPIGRNHVEKVKIGLLGLGTVGTGVVRLLSAHREEWERQTGVKVEIVHILVKDRWKKRNIEVDPAILTNEAEEVLNDPEIRIVVEVMGGIHPAREYVMAALERGKHVVTANKDLLAACGIEMLRLARDRGCDVGYEASVAGGIPILRALKESFSSDRVNSMMGIVNGTTNYVLTKMQEEGKDFASVLREAQELGYAEADPSADVDGWDAARKMVILSTLGFRTAVRLEDVQVKGIRQVSARDIAHGKRLGYVLKLLAIAKRDAGEVEVSVEPTFIPESHPLASVRGVYNAVFVHGEAVGETMFYGPGAGEMPTAMSVVSDLISVVKRMKQEVNGQDILLPEGAANMKEDGRIFLKAYLRLTVADRKGVFAAIAGLFCECSISLEQVWQRPLGDGKAEIVLVTHQVSRRDLGLALYRLKEMKETVQVESCYRVEEVEPEA